LTTSARPRRRLSPTLVALGALAAGLALGVLAAGQGGVLRVVVTVIEPLGALWVNAIRMTLVPLVVALLVTSVTSFADVRALGRLGARAAVLFLALLAGTAVVSAVLAPPLLARTPTALERGRRSCRHSAGSWSGSCRRIRCGPPPTARCCR
jgi:Na+/H+-dicarboxylate symporter